MIELAGRSLRIAKTLLGVATPAKCRGVAMFHVARCGSTVLGDLLGQHPDIQWDGEVFEKYAQGRLSRVERALPPMWVLRERMARCPKPLYGLETKVHPMQHLRADLLDQTLAEHVATLRKLGFDRFIELRRKNYLRQTVSALIGRQADKFNFRIGESSPRRRVRVEVQRVPVGKHTTCTTLLERFQAFDAVSQEIRRLIPADSLLGLSYEEHVESDPRGVAYAQVCGFLDLPAHPVDVTRIRSNPYPLADIIENYDEVASALAGTPYEWMVGKPGAGG